MPTDFPVSLDDYSGMNPTPGSSGTNMGASEHHSTNHTNHNDAIMAIEAKVGVNGSSDSTTLAYRADRTPIALFTSYANVGNTTTSETDLVTTTLAANRLADNGEVIEAEYGGAFVSSATATRRLKFYFGGTVMLDTGALTLSLSSAWTSYVTVIRVSATVVRYMVSLTTEGAALAAYTAVGEITGLTLSSTNILKVTGTAAGVGAATNDILSRLARGSWTPAP